MGVHIVIDRNICDLCGLCVEYCPTYVFSKSGGEIRIDESKCIECYACIPLCPKKAIKIEAKPEKHGLFSFAH